MEGERGQRDPPHVLRAFLRCWKASSRVILRAALCLLRRAFSTAQPWLTVAPADGVVTRVTRDCTSSLQSAFQRLPLRTPTLPPATHTNTWLVGHGAFWVVEPASPWEDEQRALDALVRRRRAAGEVLLGAIVTHHHGDHAGGARAFCATHGVALYAHRETRRLLADTVDVTQLLDEGDVLEGGIHVLHTPGHAPGHLCLWSPDEGWMIAGDMVASVGTILIDPDHEGDMDHYLAQLERLRALRPSVLLPAHGDPIDDAVAHLTGYIAHRLQREARVREAVGTQVSSLEAIVARAYADTPHAPPMLAEKATRAHLARLERLGELRRVSGGWRRQ